MQIDPVWSEHGKWLFFERHDARTGKSRRMRVDLERRRVSPLLDEAAVAAGLAELLQREVDPGALPILRVAVAAPGSVDLLVKGLGGGRLVRVNAGGVKAVPIEAGHPFAASLQPVGQGKKGNASGGSSGGGGGGGGSGVVFVNQSAEPLELRWLEGGGQERSYGVVQPGSSRDQHTFAGHAWRVYDAGGTAWGEVVADRVPKTVLLTAPVVARAEPEPAVSRQKAQPQPTGGGRLRVTEGALVWTKGDERKTLKLPEGAGRYAGPVNVSPTGTHAAVWRVTPGLRRQVTVVESSPKDQVQPKVHTFGYAKPGDVIEVRTPVLVDLLAGEVVAVDDGLFKTPWRISHLHWSPSGDRLFFVYNQRGHRVVRLLSVATATGEVSAVIDERPKTFFDYSQKLYIKHLDDSDQVLWMSERSGFNHLYRVDRASGQAAAVTHGEWVVRRVVSVDPVQRTAMLQVMGRDRGQDPYHMHYLRVPLEGGEAVALTEADGTHELTFSPDGAFYIDRYCRVDLAPVFELRRASDGGLVAELSRADASALASATKALPEVFKAHGRDGKTAIWGLIYRPTNFDPRKQYPVIESIYAGPHGFHTPKTFKPVHRQAQSLADHGFIVVRCDGMGTNWRSKAFHDVAFKNLKDAGFPDRIAWIKAAAKRYPQMDISRVGIFGGSAGGQNAMRAVLDHHDFYDAAYADCGCHDNRMDKIWWNEAWMSYPVDASYAASSNVDDAHKLGGALFLAVGELDRNVDPASTMQVVDALIKADKDFQLLVVPGGGHGAGLGAYGTRRMTDFFVRQLHGVEPRWTGSRMPTPRR